MSFFPYKNLYHWSCAPNIRQFMVLNAFLTECTKLAMALRSITQRKKNQITLKRAVVHCITIYQNRNPWTGNSVMYFLTHFNSYCTRLVSTWIEKKYWIHTCSTELCLQKNLKIQNQFWMAVEFFRHIFCLLWHKDFQTIHNCTSN